MTSRIRIFALMLITPLTNIIPVTLAGAESLPQVVINEIHYHPNINTEAVEFVELYNASMESVEVSHWYFSGITYVFPADTWIAAQDYIVVCEDPNACFIKFGVAGLGPFAGQLNNEGERITLNNSAGETIDEVDYDSDFPWPLAANGEGASMELLHPGLDNDLAGSWRSSGYHEDVDRPESAFGLPTPGSQNSVYTANVPPQIRQVNHEPEQPLSNQQTVITAKVTDPDGVKQVMLKYQVVKPGSYIPAYLPVSPISSLIADPSKSQPINPDFEAAGNWNALTMVDNGTGQDAVAGDDIYTAVIPAQVNRTLTRYRIVAEDDNDHLIQVPYADDASLNFAYYVYDGVPDYTASRHSVHPDGPGHVYSSEILTSIPVYTLITRAKDFYQCNGHSRADWIPQGNTDLNCQYAGRVYNWEGALVYEGKVYDHMGYRLRGGNGRYNYAEQGFDNAGKRSMKFRFNRGNYFQARDLFGDEFPSKWQHLNTGKMYGNQLAWGRYRSYPYGLNEVMDMLLFEAADVPAYKTWWIHLRVVDGIEEAPTTTNGQYEGDFWGLYLALEDYDGAFLKRLGLPKGNLYKLSDKIYDGLEQLRYQGEFAVDDASDYENIRWNLNHEASADFIHHHMDCNEWYRYHTVIDSIRSFDQFSGAECFHCLKNLAWYFYPDYTAENNYFGKVQFLPFDVDDTWGPYFNYGIDHGKGAIYDVSFDGNHVYRQYELDPEKSPLRQDFRNYIREFRDLHWQPEVINGMIDELAVVIADFVPADRDRWRQDYTVPGSPIDNGPLENGIALMKQFAWTSGTFEGGFYWEGTAAHLDDLTEEENDAVSIPKTPKITYTGAQGYPINDLRFQTSEFVDPQGSGTFAAMKWRIAEYDLNYSPVLQDPADEVILRGENSLWRYVSVTISSGGPVEAAQVSPLSKSKYELSALWESAEITNPADLTIKIPGNVVEPGRTYRVRSRMKDDTGRWSHWSSPIEFIAGEATEADILNYLRVSELMYNPLADANRTYDNDEFEFIELKNISTTVTLDLSTVSITDGVEFAFADSHVTSLGPGEFVIVVCNQAAFESRYGMGLSGRIAGTYDGHFANGGERVELSDVWYGTIVSFTYDDGLGWPPNTDGGGLSLVPKNVWSMKELQAGILNDPDSWRASSYINGSPGQ